MRAHVLFAGLVTISIAVVAEPASAKASIVEANVSGRGLGGGMKIEASDAQGLWESGIDVVGGLDDTRSDSVEELGLTPADLGPKYLVSYRFEFSDDLIRQDLYPYAKGGPVTYASPGQEVTAGPTMSITAGWYQNSPGFFQYLVDLGLTPTNPAASVTNREPASDRSGVQMVPRSWIVVVLVGLAALSLAALAVLRSSERRTSQSGS